VSSSTSPELELELHPPWGVLATLAAWLLAVAFEIWSLEDLPPVLRVVATLMLFIGLASLPSLATGLFPLAVRSITWTANGTWRLCDGCGREWHAVLAANSRRWGLLTILVWTAGPRRSWAILTPVTVGAGPYRRLSVRWRLEHYA
jgi:hypothetical protein